MLADPDTGVVFEGGGDVDSKNGELVQVLPRDWQKRRLIPAAYVAACSLLVRRTAVEAAGVMRDLFISGDDVEWCCRVRRVTGLGFAAVPASVAFHPQPDKMRTWGRYYAARNALIVMDAAGVTSRRAKFRRAMREVGRATCQVLVGRDDLASLHLKGLRDSGRPGPAAQDVVKFEAWRPIGELPSALREAVAAVRGRVMVQRGVVSDVEGLVKTLNLVCVAPDIEAPCAKPLGRIESAGRIASRLVRRSKYGVAVVSARGRADDWLAARLLISVDERAGGFAVRKIGRAQRAVQLLRAAARGFTLAAHAALAGQRTVDVPDGQAAEHSGVPRRPTLSIVVLSFNRWPALKRTLTRLARDPATHGAELIVVDNGSTDGTPGKVAAEFPSARVIALKTNVGIGAFNEGVLASAGEAVLILDDDAWPDEGVVEQALDLLARRPDVGAVSLKPVHPESRASEWAFADGVAPTDRWPVMGCGNLVRRTAWDRVGGYEPAFFLYRNDVDLALKLLGSGHRVYFDPAWVVWHETSAGAGGRKSARWFELASRNWVWLCRRHGAGWTRWKAMLAGWLWAHRQAGLSIGNHMAVARGVGSGLVGTRAPLPRGTRRGSMQAFLQVRMNRSAS